MSDPKRGFDPLASLFDGPDLGEFTDPGGRNEGLRPEATDPRLSMSADLPLDVLTGKTEGASPSDLPEPGLNPPPAEAEEEADAENELHKLALARSLAKAAIAKAQSRARDAETRAAAEQEQAKRARNEARARAAGAKALAQAAVQAKQAKAQAQAQSEQAQSEQARSEQVRSEQARPAAPKPKVVSRLDGLATRARRPTSALDAARAAVAQEKQVQVHQAEEAAQARERALPEQVDAILRSQLKGVERLKVGKALAMDDRGLLTALWKAHRARFAGLGALSDVVSTTRVIHALETVATGRLVAAIVLTESSDYLVWIDLSSGTTIAAFPDARAWYAQAR